MIKLLTIFASILMFFATTVFSQSPSPAPAATSGFSLNFPVESLGGCDSLEACTTYCEDPVNYNSCSTFAKENGFYQDDQTTYADDAFWTDTQSQLGCNSAESCFTYCSDPANHASCDSLPTGMKSPEDMLILLINPNT